MNTEYAKPTTLRAAGLNDLASLLKDQRARALDVVAPASAIRSESGLLVVSGVEPVITDDGVDSTDGAYQLTRTAESGLASKLGIPVAYLRRMRQAGRFDLYDANVNGWLRGHGVADDEHDPYDFADADPRKFLVRILRGDEGGEGYVRAVLSDTYKVIDSLDVLLATLDGIREAGVAVDVRECDLTEAKMHVKLWSPEVATMAPKLLENYRSPFEGGAMRFGAADGRGWDLERAREAARREGLAFEPGKEPIVFAGFVIGNSETGEGRFTIAPQIVVQACGNGLTITGDAIAKTHLGGKLDAGRIRWSDDTEAANLALIKKQTRDAVRDFLSTDYVEAKVAELEAAAGAPVTDAKETVQLVAKKLSFNEREADSILEHFLMGGQRTAGGLMQAVSSVAQTVEDGDLASDLEARAIPAMQLAAAQAGR